MSLQRTTGTDPETALRRELHRRGLRYRVNRAPVAGIRRTADVVFSKARVAVFVDGCFWHGCPDHKTFPRANAEWWRAKLTRNVERDRETDRTLMDSGWLVIRVWEHENSARAAARIARTVRSRAALARDHRRAIS
jgi:DNA mismatch endonuclease (patch repair protein)